MSESGIDGEVLEQVLDELQQIEDLTSSVQDLLGQLAAQETPPHRVVKARRLVEDEQYFEAMEELEPYLQVIDT